MNKTLTIIGAIALSLLIFSSATSVNAAFWSGKDLITPDSSFSFLQTWKESIQTFFTFGAENKVKQYLHLAEVRLNEYKKMEEQGKTEIAQKTLDKYEKQLNQALGKAQELKDKGEDVKDLSQKIEEAVSRHLGVLQNNLEKVSEQARNGIENAIENSRKGMENVLGKKACTQEAKLCPDGSAVGRTGPNCEFAECPDITKDWKKDTSVVISDITVNKFLENGFVADGVINEKKVTDIIFIYGDNIKFLIQMAGTEITQLSEPGHFKRYATCDNEPICNGPRIITVYGVILSTKNIKADEIIMVTQ